jgi:predicted nucleic acid-binding protein
VQQDSNKQFCQTQLLSHHRVHISEAATAAVGQNADTADLFLAGSAKVYGLTLVTSDRNLLRSNEISVLEN